ncbi:hypothetical protein EUX98_g4910 [Antrodiella citrinella]|uniref:Uncharacterized protein n=1 Tax=Antrodiella citrinella TaxID=2447956 RepID=A0A4S4MSV3_9APHY|nr:hypothetical protein EUX98_g4910 [Antrodiella citrinella]
MRHTRASSPQASSDDELNFFSGATSPTLVGSLTPSSSLDKLESSSTGNERILRKRGVKLTLPAKPTKQEAQSAKRKRTQSESKVTEAAAKRARMGDKVAHTAQLNKRRIRVENARRRWLLKHRNLFEPLLPENSAFFNALEKENKVLHDSGAYLPLHELDEQPSLIEGGEMKDYQLYGLSFLAWMYHNGMNCVLADEMGLGKTLQTLSLFAYIAEHESLGSMDPHLIICPLSVLSAWLAEAKRWLPSFTTLRFHGPSTERARLREDVRSGKLTFDICVTTYECYVAEDTWFKSKQWTYVVLDEGHKIKNSGTTVAHKLQGLGSLYKLILTGTPIQNNLVELWGLLHWLYPKVFTQASERLFQDSWDLSRGSYSTTVIGAANKLLATIMLHRTKAVVECSVPAKEELTVFIPMTEAQRFWTLGLLTRLDVEELEKIFQSQSGVKGESNDYIAQMKQTAKQGLYKRLQNLLMQLRMVCDHPYLLPDAEPTPFYLGEHIVTSSAKLTLVDKLLADLLPKGDRVLIFTQWTGMLDLLEDFLTLRGIPYARLDGNTSRPRRTLDIRLFQKDDSPYKVFLVSTRAGGLGINLTKASHVIMFDCDWNPQNDLQAIARAHRIGQTKTVKVYRLICQGSVEDQMLDRLRRKLFLSVKIMGSTSFGSDPSDSSSDPEGGNSSINELMDILRRGSSTLSNGGAGGMSLRDFLNADVKTILSASRRRDDVRVMKMEKDLDPSAKVKNEIGEDVQKKWEEEEQALLAGVAQVQSRLFEGQLVQRAVPKSASHSGMLKKILPAPPKASSSYMGLTKASRENREMADTWKEVQRRANEGDESVVVVNGLEVDMAFVGAASYLSQSLQRSRNAKLSSMRIGVFIAETAVIFVAARIVHERRVKGCCEKRGNDRLSAALLYWMCAICKRCWWNALPTCPQAFCEDCLPFSQITPLGESIPEFQACQYPAQPSAYFIRCVDCLELFQEQPEVLEGWEEEWKEAERKVEMIDNHEHKDSDF